MDDSKRKFIQFLFEKGALNVGGEYTLKSGRIAPWFLNTMVLSEGDSISVIGDYYAKQVPLDTNIVFGPAYAAIPLAVATSISLNKLGRKVGYTYDRKEVKAYGENTGKEDLQSKILVGSKIRDGDKITIVEDVITTGQTKQDAVALLRRIAGNLNFNLLLIVADRQEVGTDGKSAIEEFTRDTGIKVSSIICALDVHEYLVEKGMNAEAEKMRSYLLTYGTDEAKRAFAKGNVVDRLYSKMDEKRTPLCVGLDPNLKNFPKQILDEATMKFGSTYLAAAEAIRKFNFAIIDATHDLVPAYKLQSAFYEQYGHQGIKVLEDTVRYARSKGAIVILDAKRNDIGHTSTAYAESHLGKVMLPDGTSIRSSDDFDFMTVNGYLGSDGVIPFVEVANRDDKGIFILAKTSNPGAGELQDLETYGWKVYEVMANLINDWGKNNIGKNGYSNIGAVVGATYPQEASKLRSIMPNTLFLMPGYGKQGGNAEILANGFDDNGRGAVVNSSRAIIYAFSDADFMKRHPDLAKPEKFVEAARQATIDAVREINEALKSAGKLPIKWI